MCICAGFWRLEIPTDSPSLTDWRGEPVCVYLVVGLMPVKIWIVKKELTLLQTCKSLQEV